MSALDGLAACAGSWRGTSTLQDPHAGKPDESASTATVTPVLGGRFVRLDYTWSYGGQPQEGSLLVGWQKKPGTVTAHWIDSWHNGSGSMSLTGPAPDGGSTLTVRGSYPAPPGPDWGWRIDLTPGGGTLSVVMHNVWPEGKEELAVEAAYTRA
jgi:Protein of unknown function (DUF1579)